MPELSSWTAIMDTDLPAVYELHFDSKHPSLEILIHEAVLPDIYRLLRPNTEIVRGVRERVPELGRFMPLDHRDLRGGFGGVLQNTQKHDSPFDILRVDIPTVCWGQWNLTRKPPFIRKVKQRNAQPLLNILASLNVLLECLNGCISSSIESPRPQLMTCSTWIDEKASNYALKAVLSKALLGWLDTFSCDCHLSTVEDAMSETCQKMDQSRDHGPRTGYRVFVKAASPPLPPRFTISLGQNQGLMPPEDEYFQRLAREVNNGYALRSAGASCQKQMVLLAAIGALWKDAPDSCNFGPVS